MRKSSRSEYDPEEGQLIPEPAYCRDAEEDEIKV